MRNAVLSSALVAAMLFAFALPSTAQNRGTNARSEALDMEDKDRALVAKETVKQRKQQRNGSSSGGSSAGCGQVDIGNDSGSKKGSSQIAERQKTVIVTGNVINTANCK